LASVKKWLGNEKIFSQNPAFCKSNFTLIFLWLYLPKTTLFRRSLRVAAGGKENVRL
jgi:hypothetical protein